MNLNKTSDKLTNKKSKEVVPTGYCISSGLPGDGRLVQCISVINTAAEWICCYQDAFAKDTKTQKRSSIAVIIFSLIHTLFLERDYTYLVIMHVVLTFTTF